MNNEIDLSIFRPFSDHKLAFPKRLFIELFG